MIAKLIVLTTSLFFIACGDTNETNNEGTPTCASLPAGGGFCGSSSDCDPVPCPCSNGTASIQQCDNQVCAGSEICDEICGESGATNKCIQSPSNNTANNSANNTPNNNENNSANNNAPVCTNDLSMFSDFRRTYDISCLEGKCCDAAAACATYPNCKAYDDCLIDCFSGAGVDQACIQTCRDTNTTQEFLENGYAPFSSCVLHSDC